MSENTLEPTPESKQPFKSRYGSIIVIVIMAFVIGMTFSGCGGPDVKIVDGVASFEEQLHPYSRAEIFAFTMGRHVYDIAKEHPDVKMIFVTLTFPKNDLTDKYGKPLEQDFVMGTITISDLNEVRRYADSGAYGNEAQSLYGSRIKAMPCANLLKQDK